MVTLIGEAKPALWIVWILLHVGGQRIDRRGSITAAHKFLDANQLLLSLRQSLDSTHGKCDAPALELGITQPSGRGRGPVVGKRKLLIGGDRLLKGGERIRPVRRAVQALTTKKIPDRRQVVARDGGDVELLHAGIGAPHLPQQLDAQIINERQDLSFRTIYGGIGETCPIDRVQLGRDPYLPSDSHGSPGQDRLSPRPLSHLHSLLYR